jgi:ribosomal protein S18 acetylase RimI-like enzyme
MELAVVRNNEAAIGFWKAHGFRIKPLVVVEMLGVHGPVGGVAMVREVGHMTTAGQSR